MNYETCDISAFLEGVGNLDGDEATYRVLNCGTRGFRESVTEVLTTISEADYDSGFVHILDEPGRKYMIRRTE